MFLSVLPLTAILLFCAIMHDPVSMPLVIFVLTIVFLSVWPSIDSFPIFCAFDPLTLVSLAYLTHKFTKPIYFVIFKLAFENIAVNYQHSGAIFFIIKKLAYISASILLIRGLTDAIREIIFPLTFVFISIYIIKFTMAISLIVLDVPFIIAPV